MKRYIQLLAFFASVFSIQAAAQTIDDVLKKHYKAAAYAKLEKTTSVEMDGMITRNDIMPYKISKLRPNLYRLDFQVADLEVVQATDGKEIWQTTPWLGNTPPSLMPAEAAKFFILSIDFEGSLWNWKQKGSTVELLGKEKIADAEAFKIKLTRADKGIEYYFIDATSYLLLRRIQVRTARGADVEFETNYSNYKTYEGIPFALTYDQKMGGQQHSLIEFETITLNKPMDVKMFSK